MSRGREGKSDQERKEPHRTMLARDWLRLA
jgi:hypothetical protein